MAKKNTNKETVKDLYSQMVNSAACKHRMNSNIGSMYSYAEGNEEEKHIITKELRAIVTTKGVHGISEAEASEQNIQYLEFPSIKSGDNVVEINTDVGFFPVASGVHKGMKQFRDILQSMLNSYCAYNNQEYTVIARRMVLNMVFLRWTFRNMSDRANQVKKVVVKLIDRNTEIKRWEFDGQSIIDAHYSHLDKFDYTDSQIEEIVELVNDAFMGKRESVRFNIEGHLYALAKDIFPSQCFIDKNNSNNNAVSSIGKVLYTKDNMCALTSDKVNNGIRTIDTWYGEEGEEVEALPINEYAPNRDKVTAFRTPSSNKSFWYFYEEIFKSNLEEDITKHKSIVDFGDNMHYMVAMIIKGFVSAIKVKEKD